MNQKKNKKRNTTRDVNGTLSVEFQESPKGWAEEFESYKPTIEGLNAGIAYARMASEDKMLILYSTCFLFDHLKGNQEFDQLHEELYKVSFDYAFKKKMGEIGLTETERKLMAENELYAEIVGKKNKEINRAKYFIEKDFGLGLGLPMMK